jgi:hypothetical protein
MSLCLLRALLPRVMTATEARRGLILLPVKCSCSAHAYNRGSSPSLIRVPGDRFAGDRPGGGPSPPPSPICRGSGVHPRFAGDRGSSPSPAPIGGSVPSESRFPAESGNGDSLPPAFPGPRPNRESGEWEWGISGSGPHQPGCRQPERPAAAEIHRASGLNLSHLCDLSLSSASCVGHPGPTEAIGRAPTATGP